MPAPSSVPPYPSMQLWIPVTPRQEEALPAQRLSGNVETQLKLAITTPHPREQQEPGTSAPGEPTTLYLEVTPAPTTCGLHSGLVLHCQKPNETQVLVRFWMPWLAPAAVPQKTHCLVVTFEVPKQ